MNSSRIMSQSFIRIRKFVFTFLFTAVFVVSGVNSSSAQQQPQPQPQPKNPPQFSIQSVVTKQAALVSEFEVNGLNVLMKLREGSLTVAAGLFIRGCSAYINAETAGIETLMLITATEASAGFPREIMRSEL
jgi:hypothetical protein